VAFRDARLRFSEEFLLYKMTEGITDRVADHRAIIATKDELSILQAEKEIAKYAYQSSTEGINHRPGEAGHVGPCRCSVFDCGDCHRLHFEQAVDAK